MQKREVTLTKDDYFISLLNVEKQLSEDPSTQMSACIASCDGRLLALGHNRAPYGFFDMPWDKDKKDELLTKYPYVVHAERDAISKAIKNGSNITGSTIYILNYPCNQCAIEIVNFGITEVVYVNDSYSNANFTKAARIILERAGVKCRKYETE